MTSRPFQRLLRIPSSEVKKHQFTLRRVSSEVREEVAEAVVEEEEEMDLERKIERMSSQLKELRQMARENQEETEEEPALVEEEEAEAAVLVAVSNPLKGIDQDRQKEVKPSSLLMTSLSSK